MKKTSVFFLLFLVLSVFSSPLVADNTDKLAIYEAYIDQYKDIAVREMHKYKIPASIILAQGLLESGAGRQRLAVKANNHFGIKCHTGWTGKRIYHDDDAKNECFRSYRSAEESFEDHSKFLLRDRYASLFKLKVTDYKGWARGLKSCGYATDPQYANKLIRIIEDYNLHRYDTKVTWLNGKDSNSKGGGSKSHKNANVNLITRPLYKSGKLVYVRVVQGDNLESISKEVGVSVRKLRRYNELPKDYVPKVGDNIFLHRKHRKALKPYTTHVLQRGESLHDVSQKYGVRMKSLMRRNDLDGSKKLQVGDIIRLR